MIAAVAEREPHLTGGWLRADDGAQPAGEEDGERALGDRALGQVGVDLREGIVDVVHGVIDEPTVGAFIHVDSFPTRRVSSILLRHEAKAFITRSERARGALGRVPY